MTMPSATPSCEILDPPPRPGIAAAALPLVWTRDHVATRLVEAFRTLDKLPKDAGPRRAGNHWPTHVLEFADKVSQMELPPAERRERDAWRNALAFRPSGQDIDHMEAAFDWMRAVNAADPDLGATIGQWALCIARRRSVRTLCRAKGWVPASFYLARARALDMIAATLNARGAAVF